jgi:hypothetical protein
MFLRGTKCFKLSGVKENEVVGFKVLTAVVMKSTIFWDITPSSSRRFLAQLIFWILKMKAICWSETSVDTQRTTRCYIPEDGTLRK